MPQKNPYFVASDLIDSVYDRETGRLTADAPTVEISAAVAQVYATIGVWEALADVVDRLQRLNSTLGNRMDGLTKAIAARPQDT